MSDETRKYVVEVVEKATDKIVQEIPVTVTGGDGPPNISEGKFVKNLDEERYFLRVKK